MIKVAKCYEKHKGKVIFLSITLLIVLFVMPIITTKRMDRNKSYTAKEDVALYIMQYHELPPNYITKYGEDYMTNHNIRTAGYIIGGDTHINVGSFKKFGVKENARLKECDIPGSSYVITGNRGIKRLVYTCNTANVRVFYTENHYSSFVELTLFQLQLVRNIFWIIFGCYSAVFVAFYICVSVSKRKTLDAEENKPKEQ